MDAKALFSHAVEQATAAVTRTSNDRASLPTPCSDWDLHDLINHMLYELAWVPELLAGKTVAEVGTKYDGDLAEYDQHVKWEELAGKALEAATVIDLNATVHLSYGDVTAEHYLREIGGDLIIHTWDVCQSLWHSLWFNPGAAQMIYDNVLPRATEFADSGLFGTPLQVAADAPLQVKLLAFFGRAQVEPYTD